MCTAITYHHLFGRNLDLEYGYNEQVVITPQNYPLSFRKGHPIQKHYALVGAAVVDNGYPLYFDAMNDSGLCMAGLDFPNNAYYPAESNKEYAIAPFELIPWLLCQCQTVSDAKVLLSKTDLINIPYSQDYPQAPLHWILSDPKECIVLEPMKDGLQIYENPIGVLCNNPPFPYHVHHLAEFQHLSPKPPHNHFEPLLLPTYAGGMGAIGLPGDFSSASRFVKAAFVTKHSHCANERADSVTQFFHLLDTVAMPRGAIRVRGEQDEITRYSSCCDMKERIYYFTTYQNRRIHAISLGEHSISKSELECFPMASTQEFLFLN